MLRGKNESSCPQPGGSPLFSDVTAVRRVPSPRLSSRLWPCACTDTLAAGGEQEGGKPARTGGAEELLSQGPGPRRPSSGRGCMLSSFGGFPLFTLTEAAAVSATPSPPLFSRETLWDELLEVGLWCNVRTCTPHRSSCRLFLTVLFGAFVTSSRFIGQRQVQLCN